MCARIGPVVTTRTAGPGDVEAVRALVRAAYQHYVSRLGMRPAPMDADYGARVAGGRVHVAERGDVIVGAIVLHERPDHLLIENVAVSPDAQGQGIGKTLLALAEREAAARGLTELRLYTNEAMTENLAYYPRRGYLETHRGPAAGHGRRVYFAKTL
jgi:ribosomal protein S18 acetylase RimI-like enzyme